MLTCKQNVYLQSLNFIYRFKHLTLPSNTYNGYEQQNKLSHKLPLHRPVLEASNCQACLLLHLQTCFCPRVVPAYYGLQGSLYNICLKIFPRESTEQTIKHHRADPCHPASVIRGFKSRATSKVFDMKQPVIVLQHTYDCSDGLQERCVEVFS